MLGEEGQGSSGQGAASPCALSANALPMPSLAAGADFMELSHTSSTSAQAAAAETSMLRVHIVQPGVHYCARVADVVSYGDVNREVGAALYGGRWSKGRGGRGGGGPGWGRLWTACERGGGAGAEDGHGSRGRGRKMGQGGR